MKYLISLPLAAATAGILYLIDDRGIDIWYLGIIAIIFNVCYARLAEFILKKPMWVAGWFGMISKWKTVKIEERGRRIMNLALYLLLIPAFCFFYLYFEPSASSETEEPDPAQELEQQYDSMH